MIWPITLITERRRRRQEEQRREEEEHREQMRRQHAIELDRLIRAMREARKAEEKKA